MTQEFDYKRYLASREWGELRLAVRQRAARVATVAGLPACEHCRARPIEQTHHLTYERLGHELLADLLGVCDPCHDYLSGVDIPDPARSAEAIEAARERLRSRPVPPDGAVYWHGANGRPCPCEECCSGVRRAPRDVVRRWARALAEGAA